jgi:hypothetical protein
MSFIGGVLLFFHLCLDLREWVFVRGLFYWFLHDRLEAGKRVPCDWAVAGTKVYKVVTLQSKQAAAPRFLGLKLHDVSQSPFSRPVPALNTSPLLPDGHRTRRFPAEIAAHRDALRINGPRELTAESSTAIVRKRADQLIGGSMKYAQCRC